MARLHFISHGTKVTSTFRAAHQVQCIPQPSHYGWTALHLASGTVLYLNFVFMGDKEKWIFDWQYF
jgi:hypothetical protein